LSADEDVLGRLSGAWRAEVTRLFPEAGAPALPRPSDSDTRLFESLAQLIRIAAEGQPLLLILEDLHWADDMSFRFMAFVGRRIKDWAALVLATARDDEVEPAPGLRASLRELDRDPGLARVELVPLTRTDTEALVRTLIKGRSHTIDI